MAASAANVGRQSPIDDDDGFVYVFDRREKDAPEIRIPTGGLFSFSDFKERVKDVSDSKTFKSLNFILDLDLSSELTFSRTYDFTRSTLRLDILRT